MDKKMEAGDVRSVTNEIASNIVRPFTVGVKEGFGKFIDMAQESKSVRKEEEINWFQIIGGILEVSGFLIGKLFTDVEKIIKVIEYASKANEVAEKGYDKIKPELKSTERRLRKEERKLPNFTSIMLDAASAFEKNMIADIDEFVEETMAANPGITIYNIEQLYLRKFFNKEFWDLSSELVQVNVKDISHAATARGFYEYKIMSEANEGFEKLFKRKGFRKKMGMQDKFGENGISDSDMLAVAKQLRKRVPLDMENIGRESQSLDKNPDFNSFYNYLSRSLQVKHNVVGLNPLLEESLVELVTSYNNQLALRKEFKVFIDEENVRIENRNVFSGIKEAKFEVPKDEDEMRKLLERIPQSESYYKHKFEDLAMPYSEEDYAKEGLAERDKLTHLIALLMLQNDGKTTTILDISTEKLDELEGYHGADLLPEGEDIFQPSSN